MAQMYNIVVSDKGNKATPIGTVWFDETRKAPISGYISKDALSAALKDKVVTTTKADAKSKFVGQDVFRIAAFKAGPKQNAGEGL